MSETDRFLELNLIKPQAKHAAILPYSMRKHDFVEIATNRDLKLFFYFFQFLEGCYLIGPSLNIFKLSMLNKKMYHFIKEVYNFTNFKDFNILYSK